LPLDAIDPVLSSASASSSFLIPHNTSDVTLTLSLCWPNSFVKVVATSPVPATSIRKLPCSGLVKTGVIEMLKTSVRLNSALKTSMALALSCAVLSASASFDSIRAVESTAACIAALAELPRL